MAAKLFFLSKMYYNGQDDLSITFDDTFKYILDTIDFPNGDDLHCKFPPFHEKL